MVVAMLLGACSDDMFDAGGHVQGVSTTTASATAM